MASGIPHPSLIQNGHGGGHNMVIIPLPGMHVKPNHFDALGIKKFHVEGMNGGGSGSRVNLGFNSGDA
jgi:hypothetical protein